MLIFMELHPFLLGERKTFKLLETLFDYGFEIKALVQDPQEKEFTNTYIDIAFNVFNKLFNDPNSFFIIEDHEKAVEYIENNIDMLTKPYARSPHLFLVKYV